MDADLVVFDPDGTVSVVGKELEHRHPTTPYDGMTLQGAVIATILRGQAIYEDGQVKPGSGRTLTQ
jgi:allantoinase